MRFAGGEPLLHPDIFKMVKIALSLTSNVSIGTNGLLLSKYVQQVRKSGLKKVTVSLHSLNPDTFEKITGIRHQAYFKIIESIKKLKEFVQIKLNVVILKNFNINTEELKKLLDFAVENDLNMEFQELDLGSIRSFDFVKYHYAPDQLADDIKKIKGISFNFNVAKSNWRSRIQNSEIRIQKSHCFNRLCKRCILSRPILVYPDGKINRCRLGKPIVKGTNIGL